MAIAALSRANSSPTLINSTRSECCCSSVAGEGRSRSSALRTASSMTAGAKTSRSKAIRTSRLVASMGASRQLEHTEAHACGNTCRRTQTSSASSSPGS